MLKEKVIKRLQEYPETLNMTVFKCGTEMCLAGHIVEAAGEKIYDDNQVRKSLSENCWTDSKNSTIALLARDLWAEEYGEDSAKSLPFYDSDWCDILNIDVGEDILFEVTANDVINWLKENIV